ncbi:MAG: AbrB/MazE/SpoVT family DNA-binding domain-containing protein [Syntrophobacteraceae bacterium]
MELTKVKRNYQITIPQNLRKKVNLAVGDYVEVDTQDGMIVIKPVKIVHPDQAYFYTKEWLEKEAEADADIERGDVKGPFDNVEDALNTLKNVKV